MGKRNGAVRKTCPGPGETERVLRMQGNTYASPTTLVVCATGHVRLSPLQHRHCFPEKGTIKTKCADIPYVLL